MSYLENKNDVLEKYNSFFLELKKIPVKSEERMQLFEKYEIDGKSIKDDLTLDLACYIKPRWAAPIKKTDELYSEEFLCSLNETLYEFTGMSKTTEKEYSFVAMLVKKYNQYAEIKDKSDDFEVETAGQGFGTTSKRTKTKIMKLVKQVRRMKESRNLKTQEKIMELAEEINKESSRPLSKEHLKSAVHMVMFKNDSLQKKVGDDGKTEAGDNMLYYQAENKGPKENEYLQNQSRMQEIDEFQNLFAILLGYMEKEVFQCIKKVDRDYIKIFITRLLLIELKLRKIEQFDLDEMKKNDKDRYEQIMKLREKKCSSWCAKSGNCKLSGNNKGCYFRYEQQPAGDDDIYDALQRSEKKLWEVLMHHDYLCEAFGKNPNDLYDVYQSYLKEGFEFTNTVIADMNGCAGGTISKQYKKFKEESMPAIYRYCLSCKEQQM